MKLQHYTLRYFVIALLGVIAIWATLFYMLIIEEVYDNIDDGLKNSKLLIIRETLEDKTLLNTPEYGIHQFTITPLPRSKAYDYADHFTDTIEYMEYDEDNEPVRLLKTVFKDAEGNPYKLTIRASMVEEDELMEDIMIALIALYVMLVISIAIINHLILKKVWKSFHSMLERLKKYRLGTGEGFRAPDSPILEFKMLGAELEDVLKRNEQVYTSQKEFIENASHELQTPLAISLNKLELFVEKNNLSESQMMDIGNINDTLHRLVRLNKSLLMLSKIDNRQYNDEESIDFKNLIKTVIEDFEDFAKYKNVTVTAEFEGNISFIMNKSLAASLVSNLVKNAILHNYHCGSVKIILDSDSISITNTGETALDKNLVFTRFYKAMDNTQSTGLGLSIVQSIVNIYKLQLDYSFNDSHTFTVKFH